MLAVGDDSDIIAVDCLMNGMPEKWRSQTDAESTSAIGSSKVGIPNVPLTRRAATGLIGRAERICSAGNAVKVWGETFHAVANRLLRIYSRAMQMQEGFTVMDQGDAAGLMNPHGLSMRALPELSEHRPADGRM